MQELNFIDELIAEAESKETANSMAYYDMLILQAQSLEDKICELKLQADSEISLIQEWQLKKSAQIDKQLDSIRSKLQCYIIESELKTLELPHGTLKYRKNPDRAVITDMVKFMEHANPHVVTIVPEQVKPDLTKIKSFIKNTGTVPQGVELVPGEQVFSISYNVKEVFHGEAKARA